MKRIVAFITGLFIYSETAAKPNEIIAPRIRPFLSLEGSYSWRDINSISVEDETASKNNQPWGGRVALGLEFVLVEQLRFSNEVAFGYYGSTTIHHPLGYSVSHEIDGVDLLAGLLYPYYTVDWFFKVGGIVQNNYSKRKTFNNEIANAFLERGVKAHHQEIGILPEIKVGGLYPINEKLGVSLSYMHIFASTLQGNIALISTDGGIHVVTHETSLNPSVNSILLGLRYLI